MPNLSKNAEETKSLAKELLKRKPKLKSILLKGDLGSGKTTFVKGLAEALGLDPNSIKSPTFSLREDHVKFIHYDLYRLEEVDLLLEEQIQEDLESGVLVVVEWPERFGKKWPQEALHIEFQVGKGDARELSFNPPL